MTVTRIWKRVRCPKCKALIRVRLATDGSWILQDSKPSLHPPSEIEEPDEYLEKIQKLIEKRLKEHEESSYHA